MKDTSNIIITPDRELNTLIHDGGAVDDGRVWRVLYVHTRSEIKCSNNLERAGFQTFVAYQKEIHTWANKKRKVVDVIKIPNVVFIRATEKERETILKMSNNHLCFMLDKATKRNEYGKPKDAIIPEHSIREISHILNQTEVSVDYEPSEKFEEGDRVRIVDGPFQGMIGKCIYNANHCDVYFIIECMTGAFKISTSLKNVKKA